MTGKLEKLNKFFNTFDLVCLYYFTMLPTVYTYSYFQYFNFLECKYISVLFQVSIFNFDSIYIFTFKSLY